MKFLTEINTEFEDIYLKTRKLEGRVYKDSEAKDLPDVNAIHQHSREWKLRKKSSSRFVSYLKQQPEIHKILEIGCGNGWFSALMAREFEERTFIGFDLNKEELEQADRIFNYPNLEFVYADIFEDLPGSYSHFDLIVLPSSVQYFRNLSVLLGRLKVLTREIHILDSHFYDREDLFDARQRSFTYYDDLGVPEMADLYFHHSREELMKFDPEYLYRPKKGLVGRIFSDPFPWVKITSENV